MHYQSFEVPVFMIKINYNVDLMLVKIEQNDLFRLIRKLNKEVEIIKIVILK